jgi:hypothetical protein
MNEQLSGHHLDFIGGVRGCLFCPCCHVWSLLSKKTTPTLPLLHRQAKKRADSCSGYRPEIPAERAPAGGEGRQRRRVAARPWGKRRSLRGPWGKRCSLRGVVHHIRSMGGSTRYVMTSFLLIPRPLLLSGPAAACTNQCQASDETCSALAWARARPSRQQHSYPNCSKPLRGDTGLPQYFRPDLPSISVPGDK